MCGPGGQTKYHVMRNDLFQATIGGFAKYVRTETIPGGFDNAPKTFDEDAQKLGFKFGEIVILYVLTFLNNRKDHH